MPFETALQEDALQRIAQIGQAEILVGIPSYNNAGTIAHVVKMAAQGMVKYFPDMKPLFHQFGRRLLGTARGKSF